MAEVSGFFYPRTATGRSSLHPPAAVVLLRRPAHRGVPHRPGAGRRAAARPARAGRRGPRRRRADLGRLAVLLATPARSCSTRCARSTRRLRRRPLHLRGPDLLPLRLHLGRQGLRHRPRDAPGLPEEARLDVADAPHPFGQAAPQIAAGGTFGAHAGRRRPPAGRGRADAARGVAAPTASSTRTRWRTTAATPDRAKGGPDALRRADPVRRAPRRGGTGLERRRRRSSLFESPTEELARLEVDEIIGGYYRQVGVVWDGGRCCSIVMSTANVAGSRGRHPALDQRPAGGVGRRLHRPLAHRRAAARRGGARRRGRGGGGGTGGRRCLPGWAAPPSPKTARRCCTRRRRHRGARGRTVPGRDPRQRLAAPLAPCAA